MNSPEYRTMVSTTVMLTETFATDIMSVGAAFWQEGMIPPGVNDIINSRIKEPKEKSRELVSALTTKVRTSKKCFRQVVYVIIDQGDWAKNLLESMKMKYEVNGGKDFPHKPPKRKTHTNVEPDQMEQNHNNNEINQQNEVNQQLLPPEESIVENKPTSPSDGWKIGTTVGTTAAAVGIVLLSVIIGLCFYWIIGTKDRGGLDFGGVCHKITKSDQKLVHKTLATVGDWENVCLYLDIGRQTRSELQHENIPVNNKISRCVEAYFNNKLSPCFEEIVYLLCNYFHMKVPAIELAEKTGVDHQTVCKSSDF